MTAKQFFKSTGFKSVIVLLVIALVSSFLLTVLHYLWPKTEIKMDLAVVKEMYDNKSAEIKEVSDFEEVSNNNGRVTALASASDGGYIILAKASGGYGNAEIGLYVAIREGKIVAVAVADKGGETYWDNIYKRGVLDNYKGLEISQDIISSDALNPPSGSGATAPKTAELILKTVNVACWYARTYLNMGEDINKLSEEAIKAIDGYQDANLTVQSATLYDKTALVVEGATFAAIFTVNDNSEAYAYKIGDTYYAYIVNSTTREIVAKTEGVAEAIDTAIITAVKSFNIYNASVYDVVAYPSGTALVYQLIAKSVAGGMPNDYTLQITVNKVEDKVQIIDFVVVKDGSTVDDEGHDYGDDTVWKDDDTVFDGKDESGLNDMQITTGATNSNKTVINALKFALKDYTISTALAQPSSYDVTTDYGVEGVTFTFVDVSTFDYSKGTVHTLVSVSDGGLIAITEGTGGYDNGTVKLLTIVDSSAKISSIKVLDCSTQTWWDKENMGAIVEKYLTMSVQDEIALTPDLTTGASKSSTALNNAINGVVYAYQNYNK